MAKINENGGESVLSCRLCRFYLL